MTMNKLFNRRSLNPAPRLVRVFVRSNDPRCPLVAVWKLSSDPDAAAADEPSLRRPARECLRGFRRAVHMLFARIAYSAV